MAIFSALTSFTTFGIKNKKCLDIACGEGYGSVLMAEHAAEVLGCDVDEEAVKWAKTKYQKKKHP